MLATDVVSALPCWSIGSLEMVMAVDIARDDIEGIVTRHFRPERTNQ